MKKQIAIFCTVLALVVGLVSGFALCSVTQQEPKAMRVAAGDASLAGQEISNTALLGAATDVLELLRGEDYAALSEQIDPEEGITFTSYSTVDFSSDLQFTQEEFKSALKRADDYIWGVDPASGDPLRMSVQDYCSSFLWDTDYSAASEIGIDTVLFNGSAQENVLEAYPDCRVVDFSVPSQTAKEAGFYSLKLVFRRTGEKWYLMGIVHSSSVG